jgi:hypothetical protein
MAIVNNNPIMRGVTGKVGPVYFRTVRGKQIVCNMPPRGLARSPKQLENQRRFGEASKRAKYMLAAEGMKEQYQTRVDNMKFTAHMVAQSDLMKAPVVRDIDTSEYTGQAGEEIVARVADNSRIKKVVVTIVASTGEVIESGEAVKGKIDTYNWIYKTTTVNTELKGSVVRAVASDLASDEGELQVTV